MEAGVGCGGVGGVKIKIRLGYTLRHRESLPKPASRFGLWASAREEGGGKGQSRQIPLTFGPLLCGAETSCYFEALP